ncbi:MAG: hypothetical protein Q9M09_02550 [Mariprofundaceae bacterium]|nr:hypothetical protein [Mariprofundaceae bacterium]
MFLNRLNGNEKIAFLTLANHLARSDGDFSQNEKSIIATYCLEMQIKDVAYSEKEFNLNRILEEVENTESQKIILLEMMALVYADGLQEEEQNILNVIIEKFNISESIAVVYAEWSQSILSISRQGQALIKL